MSIISPNPSFKERKDHIEIATTATAYEDILTNMLPDLGMFLIGLCLDIQARIYVPKDSHVIQIIHL